jgi:hypothetical protein
MIEPVNTILEKTEDSARGKLWKLRTTGGRELLEAWFYSEEYKASLPRENLEAFSARREAKIKARNMATPESPYVVKSPPPPEEEIIDIVYDFCISRSARGVQIILPPAHMQTPEFFIKLGRALEKPPAYDEVFVWVEQNWEDMGLANKDREELAAIVRKRFPALEINPDTLWKRVIQRAGLPTKRSPGPKPRDPES